MARSKKLYILVCLLLGCLGLPGWMLWQYPAFVDYFSTAIPMGVLTGPSYFNTRFLGGDHTQIFFLGWKLKANLLHHLPIHLDPFTFANPGSSNIDMHLGVQFWLIALFQGLLGDVPGYNVAAIFLPVVLTFFSSMFLLTAVTSSRLVQVGGALALSILPFRFYQQFGGHSGGIVMFLAPLYFGALIRQQKSPKTLLYDALAGLVLFVLTLSDEHQGYYLIVFSALVFPIWGLQSLLRDRELTVPRRVWAFLWRWKFLLLGLLATALYGQIVNQVVLNQDGDGPSIVRSFGEIRHYSVDIDSFLRADSERNVGGWVLWALLGGGGLWLSIALRRDRLKELLTGLYLPIFFAFSICLFLLFGLGDHWSQHTGIYEFFYNHLPYFAYQRVPAKMFVQVAILLFILAAALFEAFRRIDRHRTLAMVARVGLGAVILAQPFVFAKTISRLAPGILFENMSVGPRGLIEALKNAPGERSVVLTLPLETGQKREDTLNQYLAWRTGKRFFGGYNGSPPTHFVEAQPWLKVLETGKPTREVISRLKQLEIGYLLVDRDRWNQDYPGVRYTIDDFDFLESLGCEENFCLYKVEESNLSPQEAQSTGWLSYINWTGRWGRWMVKGGDSPAWLDPAVAKEFKILSSIQLNADVHTKLPTTIDLIFLSFDKEFPLWILEEGRPPLEIAPPWKMIEGLGYHISFVVHSPSFLIGSKDSFHLPHDYLGYQHDLGHFLVSVKARGENVLDIAKM